MMANVIHQSNCYEGVQSLGKNLSIPTILLQRIVFTTTHGGKMHKIIIWINCHHWMNASHQLIVVKGCRYDGLDYPKVEMPNLITCLYRTSTFGYVCVGIYPIMNTKNWIICLEYVNHFMFNNQHKWKRGENPYDQIMNMRISTLTMNIIHMYKLQKLERKLIRLQFRFAHHLVLVMRFMAIWKKWPFKTYLPYVTHTQVSDIVWGHANILYGPNALIQALGEVRELYLASDTDMCN